MSISKIEITNFKSIKHCCLSLSDINLLIGENGTGKTNVLDAVHYFYSCLLRDCDDSNIYNYHNSFCNEVDIAITYDFDHLRKISISNQNRNHESNYQGFYQWISQRGKRETLRLQKIKGKPIRWNQDHKYRQNISNLFPLYTVDSREVDLTDWSNLWDMIGDLMKVHRVKESEIASEIEAIKDKEEYKLKDRFQKLSDAFSQANIRIRSFTPQQYASIITSLLFKGNVFEFQEGRLDYMSNGTSAYNYTNLLIEILKLVSEYKMKDPIIVLDEPEISLHHKLIDQLALRIFGCNGVIRFLIASHSSRLLKNTLQLEQFNCIIFHVSMCNQCSMIAPIKPFSEEPDERARIVMTDQHANAYFSRYILSVEGVSETEVFSNIFLHELFPVLRNVDVMEGMSNDSVQRAISPSLRHFGTNCLMLMDMDKVLVKHNKKAPAKSKADNKFNIVAKAMPRAEKLTRQYYYSPERTKQIICRKRIFALADRGHFHYWYPFFSTNDATFETLLHLIKEYFLDQNIYIAQTTIEGMLITYHNLDTFWAYYTAKNGDRPDFPQIASAYQSFLKNDKLNFMRLLFSGKSDFILNLDEIAACNPHPSFTGNLCPIIRNNRVSKTDGWMSEWLQYCLCQYAGENWTDAAALRKYRKKLGNPAVIRNARRQFQYDFPELFELIHIIQKQLKSQ